MSIAGKMSTTIRVSDSTPITRMSKHITATVYGRRRARRTIHIGADYRGPKSSRRPSQVNRDREAGAPGAHRRGTGSGGTSDKKSARNARNARIRRFNSPELAD